MRTATWTGDPRQHRCLAMPANGRQSVAVTGLDLIGPLPARHAALFASTPPGS